MWEVLGEVQCPILSMRGSRSDMYAPETVAKIREATKEKVDFYTVEDLLKQHPFPAK